MELPEEVLKAFNLGGELVPLKGGQNTSIRVDSAVLKPVEDVSRCERLLSLIDPIQPDGYRLAKPIRNNNGTFVYKGWSCTRFEKGREAKGRIQEKLRVSRLFHRDISHIPIRDLPPADDPWAKAHRIAWQADPLPQQMPEVAREVIRHLLQSVTLNDRYDAQIVHGDLAGNILFDEVLEPLIIDFSPTAAPIEYAEAILVCDCVAWQGSELSDIRLLPYNAFYKEMIIRAIVFRLAVAAMFSEGGSDVFANEYSAYKPIIDYINGSRSNH